jgi:hypothetical protein
MTRLNIPHGPLPSPCSIALGDLAIAAGFAGRCITLCYPDYPAPLLCHRLACLAYSGEQRGPVAELGL